ncbi:MAG: pyrroline-5-carboxylate reductase [Pseudomonadota bacterium]
MFDGGIDVEEQALAGINSVLLLGCGKMGSALLQGWLSAGLKAGSVTVLDPVPRPWLAEAGVVVNPPLPKAADVVIIAVKPQMIAETVPSLAAMGGGETLVLSIAAGTPLTAFEEIFGPNTPIVRAMPNTPAAVGQGISALIGNNAAGEQDLARAEALMASVGQTVRLEDESQMDAVTGLSGSGPAYVFHLIEAMAAAGEAEGLPRDLAMQLARATVSGAGALAAQAEESAADLRVNVTSPGGTTAAGLEILMAELPDLARRTVAAAAARSRALRG